MTCSVHPKTPSASTCSLCGMPFCEACLPGSGGASTCEACTATNGPAGRKSTPGWTRKALAILAAVGVAILLLVLIKVAVWKLIVNLRMEGGEAPQIGALRTLSSVQAQFREGDRDNDNCLDYAASLTELSNAGLIDNVLGSGTKNGYVFSLSGSTDEWVCSATPFSDKFGTRNFIVCTDCVVRYAGKGTRADCNSPVIQ